MGECRIPTVRNTIGERTQFSLDRLVRDAVIDGNEVEAARATGRQLLADLDRAGVDVVSTDAIRHWLAERDPLVFARRRCIRRADGDGRPRYLDPVLGAIAALAESAAPRVGPIVTELFLDHFRPGAGDVLFQASPDDTRKEKAPPLDQLEDPFGELADAAFPDDADFSRPGGVGKRVDPEDETGKRLLVFISADDTLDLLILRPGVRPGCDERWVLYVYYGRTAPGCAGVNYRSITRAAILQAIAYAFRVCRATPCEQPVFKLLEVSWACGADLANVFLRMEVMCLAV
ncbi:MAG: hypothetical protein ACREKS_05845 [Candidatus Rokuibacteriota bacterium]